MNAKKKSVIFIDKKWQKIIRAKAEAADLTPSEFLNELFAQTLGEEDELDEINLGDEPIAQLNPEAPKIQVEFQKVSLTQKRTGEYRLHPRANVKVGQAVVYDLQGRIVCKGSLVDISAGGVRLEIPSIELIANAQVVVDLLTGGLQLKAVACSVQWVALLEHHPQKHKIVGLKFGELTTTSKHKLEEHLEKLRGVAGSVI